MAALVVILPLRVWCQPELRIGLQKQLLVDDHVIDTRSHLKRTPGRVVKANQCRPLLIPNQPWEEPEAFGYYGSVLYDQGKFRMGYRADIREESRRLAYAESRDGLNLTGRFLAVSGSSFDVSGGDLTVRFSGRKRSFDFDLL